MIAYDIICDNLHKFEGWFKSREDFTNQNESGLLECPVCGSKKVEHISAPAIRTRRETNETGLEDIRHTSRKLREYLDKNFDDVGNSFAEEARKIHYNESEARNIRGSATAEEVKSLKDEGIECITLPVRKLDS